MKMMKPLVVLFLVFSVLSFVSALEVKKTEVVIVTDPYQNMSVVVKDIDGVALQTFAGRARKFGEYRFTYYGVVPQIIIAASIYDNQTQQNLASKDFGPYAVGNLVNVTLKYLDSEAKVIEDPVPTLVTNETNVTANISTSVPSPLTGRAVGGEIGGVISELSPVYYYVAIGLFGFGIFAFLMRRRLSVKVGKSHPKEPDHKKMFDKKEEKVSVKEEFTPGANSTVVAPEKSNAEDLQQKISALQKELEQVRGEERLIRLQRQLAREQQELKKLNNPSGEIKRENQAQNKPSPINLDDHLS
ncbi:MAG: hypothetical protein ACP5NS_01370 [Candidatus Pacearchaeota archaeon]